MTALCAIEARIVTYLSESQDPLLGSNCASVEHNVIIVDLSVVGESSEGGDGLLCKIKFSGCVVLDDLAILGVDALSNAVDLLVDFSPVVVSLLTSSGH